MCFRKLRSIYNKAQTICPDLIAPRVLPLGTLILIILIAATPSCSPSSLNSTPLPISTFHPKPTSQPTNVPNNIFYVDNETGSDSNSGSSPEKPWKTVGKVSEFSFQPGDLILFRRGQVWRESLTLPVSGTSTAPITIGAYGDEILPQPTFSGADIVAGWDLHGGYIYEAKLPHNTGNPQAFENGVRLARVNNLSNMTAGSFYHDIENKVIYVWTTDSQNPTNKVEYSIRIWGLESNGKNHWRINNLKFTQFIRSGVSFRQVDGSSDIQLDGITSNWNGLRGFDFGGYTVNNINDVIIINSIAHDNIGEGFWIGKGKNNGVDGCVSYNNGKDLANGYDTFTAGTNFTIGYGAVNNFIRNSHSYNAYGGSTDSVDVEWEDPIYSQPIGSIIEGNLIENHIDQHDTARDAGINSIWRNNIFIPGSSTNSNTVFRVWNGANGTRIYNNTFHRTIPGGAILRIERAENITVNNNILYAVMGRAIDVTPEGQNGFVSDYNIFIGQLTWGEIAYPLSQWKSITGHDIHSVSSNPQFNNPEVSDYSLRSNSPAIDQGLAIIDVKSDFNGILRPQGKGYDIGAIEYTNPKSIMITKLCHDITDSWGYSKLHKLLITWVQITPKLIL